MFRDLLVATTGHGDDAAAVSAACAIAVASGGHVAVLVQVPVPMPVGGEMGAFPVDPFVTLRSELHAQGEAACARWREALGRPGVAGEVRLVESLLSTPSQTAALHGHYADLVVVGLGEPGRLPVEVHDIVAKVLTGSGRPLLVVPARYETISRPRVAVAWRPGASASRALHDAMPFLRHAHAIDVLCVDPERGERGHGDEPGADIARHLARHGLDVTVHVVDGAGDETGQVLLRRVRELGANLLVMGGYGHARLREWALGGTTRHVLRHTPVPVLMSH
jgi:nucleotide-binding universal stress UspA family protein